MIDEILLQISRPEDWFYGLRQRLQKLSRKDAIIELTLFAIMLLPYGIGFLTVGWIIRLVDELIGLTNA